MIKVWLGNLAGPVTYSTKLSHCFIDSFLDFFLSSDVQMHD